MHSSNTSKINRKSFNDEDWYVKPCPEFVILNTSGSHSMEWNAPAGEAFNNRSV